MFKQGIFAASLVLVLMGCCAITLLLGLTALNALYAFLPALTVFGLSYCFGASRGSKTISRGNLQIRLEDGVVTVAVKVIAETPDSFVLQYSPDFAAQHPELCQEFVRKSDQNRVFAYTHFALVSDPYNGLLEMKSQPGGTLAVSVLVTEDTPTHVRLRYSRWFALKHPGLCREWIAKDDPNISVVPSYR